MILPSRTFLAAFCMACAVSNAAPSDFDGDNRSDVVWRNAASGQVYRMSMNGTSIASSAIVYQESNTAWSIVANADFNGDGISDLLWRNSQNGQVYLMPFAAGGFPTTGAVIYTEANPDWKIVHTPDLNGDGRADILWWNSSTGSVYVMLMDGTSIISQGTLYQQPITSWKIAVVGDFSGTGRKNQALWRNASTGEISLMTINASPGSFTQSNQLIYREPNTAWNIIATGDFNGDGKDDLLWRNDSGGQVSVTFMNGASFAAQSVIYTEPDIAWRIAAVGDYNGDGKADILWRYEDFGSGAGGRLYMMLMDGFSIVGGAMVYREPSSAWKPLGANEYKRAWGGYAGGVLTCGSPQVFTVTGQFKELTIASGGWTTVQMPAITEPGRHAELLAFQSQSTPPNLMTEVVFSDACGSFDVADMRCRQVGNAWTSVDLHAFSSEMGYCVLTPGRTYYANVRNIADGLDSCPAGSGTCPSRLQYFGDLR